MSYSSLNNQLQSRLGQIESTKDYYATYFSAEHGSKLQALEGKFIYHLYNDLSKLNTSHDFNAFLNTVYNEVDNYAKECVQIAYKSSDIYGMKIRGWTESALKAFDWFLIKFINEVLGEKIPKPRGGTYETDVYEYLISKQGDQYKIGIAFQSVYQQNNAFKHVQLEIEEGVRTPRKWSNKKYRQAKELVLFQFNTALVAFENELASNRKMDKD